MGGRSGIMGERRGRAIKEQICEGPMEKPKVGRIEGGR